MPSAKPPCFSPSSCSPSLSRKMCLHRSTGGNIECVYLYNSCLSFLLSENTLQIPPEWNILYLSSYLLLRLFTWQGGRQADWLIGGTYLTVFVNRQNLIALLGFSILENLKNFIFVQNKRSCRLGAAARAKISLGCSVISRAMDHVCKAWKERDSGSMRICFSVRCVKMEGGSVFLEGFLNLWDQFLEGGLLLVFLCDLNFGSVMLCCGFVEKFDLEMVG